jgi:hypothetical protein
MTSTPPTEKLVETLVWDGVTIEVRYEPDWWGHSKFGPDRQISHLEIEATAPKRAPLPVTETGYRSHFLAPGEVEEAGGPASFLRAWLDQEARTPTWRRADAARRQLDLFG